MTDDRTRVPEIDLKKRDHSRGYGWRRDLPDKRDHRLLLEPEVIDGQPKPLPERVNLIPGMPHVYAQGSLGSCTANAIAALIQYEHRAQKLPDFMPSRLFIYYCERAIENSINDDAGAEIRDGIKAVAQLGVCSEHHWPYEIDKFRQRPSLFAFAEAKRDIIQSYARITQNESQLKLALAQGFPVVFGFTVYASFEDQFVARSGKVPMPGPSEEVRGGHAVVLCGYDNRTAEWICRNSWGPQWGDHGYFYMPFAYLLDTNLAADFWAIKKVQ